MTVNARRFGYALMAFCVAAFVVFLVLGAAVTFAHGAAAQGSPSITCNISYRNNSGSLWSSEQAFARCTYANQASAAQRLRFIARDNANQYGSTVEAPAGSFDDTSYACGTSGTSVDDGSGHIEAEIDCTDFGGNTDGFFTHIEVDFGSGFAEVDSHVDTQTTSIPSYPSGGGGGTTTTTTGSTTTTTSSTTTTTSTTAPQCDTSQQGATCDTLEAIHEDVIGAATVLAFALGFPIGLSFWRRGV